MKRTLILLIVVLTSAQFAAAGQKQENQFNDNTKINKHRDSAEDDAPGGLQIALCFGVNRTQSLNVITPFNEQLEFKAADALGLTLESEIGIPLDRKLVLSVKGGFIRANNDVTSFFTGKTMETHKHSLLTFGPGLMYYPAATNFYFRFGLNYVQVSSDHHFPRLSDEKITEVFSAPGFEIAVGLQKYDSKSVRIYSELCYGRVLSKNKSTRINGHISADKYPSSIEYFGLKVGFRVLLWS